MRKTYTGVGSRNTPLYILYMMSELAAIFEKKGFVLRSGCATGADAAFEDALTDPANNAEIYVPNKGFAFNMGTTYKKHYIIPKEKFGTGFNGLYYQATRLIHQKDIHKFWKHCKPNVMDLHNRNMFQVLGLDLKSKSNFNILFTKNKETKYDDTNSRTGGTGTSINASDLYDIELFNLSVDEHYTRLRVFIDANKNLINYEKLNNIKPRTDHNERNSNRMFVHNYSHFSDIISEQRKKRELLIQSKKKEKMDDLKPTSKSNYKNK